MARKLIVLGGGGHARVVIEAAQSSDNWDVIGFVDPNPEAAPHMKVPHLGDDSAVGQHRRAYAVLGFGSVGAVGARQRAVTRLNDVVDGWGVVVHSRAIVSPTAVLEPGTVVCAGAVVQAGARVGRHSVINSGAIVEHDVAIGEFSQVAPGAVIGGGTRIGARSWIGLGAGVRDQLTLGEDVVVAMGATVVRDVPDRAVVKGTPAK